VYEEFYRLSGKPFQLTPDRRFFFASRVHHRAMAYLRYGLEQREGFIVITGPIGSGKTILVRTLFSELNDREVMAAELVTTQVGPEDMLRMVCASFGLAHEGMNKATLLHNLEVIARTRFAEGKHILLVVDEAQNLPEQSLEELRMLANFQVEGRSLVQSFLLGQEDLRRTLQQTGLEQLRQRIIASYSLEPLSAEETRSYIEFRLQRAGWKDEPSLDDALFDSIHAFTGGVPRRINAFCDRLFLYGCIEDKHALGTEDLTVVQKDMQREVSYARGRTQDTRWTQSSGPPSPFRTEETRDIGVAALQRLARLESEVARLREIVQHERKLLRKAVLMQLDLDAYDDLE